MQMMAACPALKAMLISTGLLALCCAGRGKAIVRQNGIADPNLIYTGQTLLIPRNAAGVQIIVQRGDTLWALSRQYGTTVSAIARANGIANPDRIDVGQVLTIPQ